MIDWVDDMIAWLATPSPDIQPDPWRCPSKYHGMQCILSAGHQEHLHFHSGETESNFWSGVNAD